MSEQHHAPQAMTLPEALACANAHWQAGQAVQAEQICQRILATFPGQADALHLMGLIAHAYGHLDRAIDLLQHACSSLDVAPVYASNLAEMLRQRGRLPEAERAARSALARDPNLSGAWNNLGIILQEMGQFDESREWLEKVRAAEPENPRVLNNLGNTCLRQRDLAAAESYWRAAIAIDPNYPQPYSNLAKMLTDRGELEEAVEAGRRAITLDPHLSDAYINLAAAEQERKNSQTALRWIEALLAFAPQNAQAWATKATLLKEAEHLPEALQAAEQAIGLAPALADAHYAHGSILQALGRHAEALTALQKAGELPGVKAEEALISQAVLQMELGSKKDAEGFFETAIARFPRSASAWYNWADLHRFDADDPLLERMLGLLAQDILPRDRMLLDFALGKAYLDVGDSERAFRHLHAGNAEKRKSFDYDPAHTDEFVERIQRNFPLGCFDSHPKGTEQAGSVPRPIFVVGMPRSGTSLVEQILASHSAIHGAGELSLLQKLIGELYPEGLHALPEERRQTATRTYQEYIAKLAPQALFVVDKMPANFFYLGAISLLFPGAKIIHCRRNPVDTCLSCYSKNFAGEQRFSYDLRELGRFHQAYARLMEHWQQVLPEGVLTHVDYEGLVADQEGQTRRLIEFVGLGWESGCLQFYQTERAVKTASVNQVREPIYQRSVGRWKPHAAHLGPLLEALNVTADE
ncbi:tetratricopeptide repeat-containing sulfotransferase family protein [Acidithiobacillus sp. AC3]